MSLTKAVASVDKLAANVHIQLSLGERNDTLGSDGVGLRYAVEQQTVASAVLSQGVHLVGERLVVAVDGQSACLPWPSPLRRCAVVHRTGLVDALFHGVQSAVR